MHWFKRWTKAPEPTTDRDVASELVVDGEASKARRESEVLAKEADQRWSEVEDVTKPYRVLGDEYIKSLMATYTKRRTQ